MTVITEELKAKAEEIKNEANVCFKGEMRRTAMAKEMQQNDQVEIW